ncbi:MAG: hypothetical protein U1F17_04565 [Burkholderiaceae bacterium]
MWRYEPPLREMQFVIEGLLDAPAQWARVQAADAPPPWGPA